MKNYLDSLEKGRGVQGAIVANCNPFTLGHKYLMETAAAQVDSLHVFILSENSAENAEFSAEARFELVKKGTKHIKNLLLHRSGGLYHFALNLPDVLYKRQSRCRAHQCRS